MTQEFYDPLLHLQVLDKSTSEASTQSRTVLESHPLEALDTAASETEDSAAPIGAATTDKKGGRWGVLLTEIRWPCPLMAYCFAAEVDSIILIWGSSN